ncbi:MAG: hypothetical protein R2705_01030 [Ilumatobacteraceae bacterium]
MAVASSSLTMPVPDSDVVPTTALRHLAPSYAAEHGAGARIYESAYNGRSPTHPGNANARASTS